MQPDTDIKTLLAEVRKEYPNATHYCTALITGNIQRSNDDGEPSGTAGLPMLECLRHKDLDNVLLVVVRYFGGTLLGTGGLVRAYSDAAKEALANAEVGELISCVKRCFRFAYPEYDKIRFLLEKEEITDFETEYGSDISITVYIPEDKDEDILRKITDTTKGQVSSEELGRETVCR